MLVRSVAALLATPTHDQLDAIDRALRANSLRCEWADGSVTEFGPGEMEKVRKCILVALYRQYLAAVAKALACDELQVPRPDGGTGRFPSRAALLVEYRRVLADLGKFEGHAPAPAPAAPGRRTISSPFMRRDRAPSWSAAGGDISVNQGAMNAKDLDRLR